MKISDHIKLEGEIEFLDLHGVDAALIDSTAFNELIVFLTKATAGKKKISLQAVDLNKLDKAQVNALFSTFSNETITGINLAHCQLHAVSVDLLEILKNTLHARLGSNLTLDLSGNAFGTNEKIIPFYNTLLCSLIFVCQSLDLSDTHLEVVSQSHLVAALMEAAHNDELTYLGLAKNNLSSFSSDQITTALDALAGLERLTLDISDTGYERLAPRA